MIDNNLKDKIEKVFTPVSSRRVPRNIRLVNKYQKCGTYTIDFINNLKPTTVLDLGCGDNQYKDFIPALIGIDITNPYADIEADISSLDYNDNSVDAVICFGSINFGSDSIIEQQLKEVFRVLKPNGYAIFRGNMKDHADDQELYYGWSEELVADWTKRLNIQLHEGPEVVTRTRADGTINNDWKDPRMTNIGKEARTPFRLFWIWKK
jgi:ubiquinone/menaquinone biosynthesis C-methylase UbiE